MLARPDQVPLVIVEGFFSSVGALAWGNIHEHSNHLFRADGREDRRVIFSSVGPVSSLHDRACELFYSLVGGTVDYGEEHAQFHGHKRFGRAYSSGMYPQWSEDCPLHFLGHSLGGPTILKLQWLIKTGFFGVQYHADMILSVNTISSPFRGTQLVYHVGEDATKAPEVRWFSLGYMLARCVYLLAYLAPVLPKVLDMHTESRSLSYNEISVLSLLWSLWTCEWAEAEDAAPFDVTFQASLHREALCEGATNPGTYYRSYVACITRDHTNGPPTVSWRRMWLMPVLYLSSRVMARPTFASLSPVQQNTAETEGRGRDHGGVDHAFSANDGVVPVFSQWHPFDCSETNCRHSAYALDGSRGRGYELPILSEAAAGHEELVNGVWHVYHIDAAHHLSIVPFWMGTARQKAFWRDFGSWLYAIDAKRCATTHTKHVL